MHHIYYIFIFDYYFSDSKENIDAYIDTNSIWKCMKRINSNLDFLSQKLNVVQSDQVQVQTQKAQSSTLDDFDFLLLFPLKKIEEVIELESRLMDNTSHFYKKFVSSFISFIYLFSYCAVLYTKCWLNWLKAM